MTWMKEPIFKDILKTLIQLTQIPTKAHNLKMYCYMFKSLRAATRVVQEIRKSRAAAFALGVYDMDEGTHLQGYSENTDSIDPDPNESSQPEGKSHLLLKDWGTCFSVLVASC